MSADFQSDGVFYGNNRQLAIHHRLFSMLSKYSNPYDDCIVEDWLIEANKWTEVTEGWIFASLAKALPQIRFCYETSMSDEGGDVDEVLNNIEYTNGILSFCSIHRYEGIEDYEEEDEEDETPSMDEYEYTVVEDEESYRCNINNDGIIVGNKEFAMKCLNCEIERLSPITALIDAGTDDPEELVNLGVLFETGLAGCERNLASAWDYYLKAVNSGNIRVIEFVKEIFSDECKADLKELFANKSISKNSFPFFFDLAAKENNAELTARLLEYKASLE